MQLFWHSRYPAPRRFLAERRRALEYLDRPELEARERQRSYRDLETLSHLPGQFAPLRRVLLRLAPGRGGAKDRVRLVELGAGTGHAGCRLARALARRGFAVDLVTTDLRPEQLPITAGHPRIEVSRLRVDVLADPLPPGDIVFANLLIHHFDRVDAVALLARMHAAATLGGAVFDLDRNRWAFLLARGILPLFARSAVTVADGLASVQQAFRRDELAGLAREAGIPTPRLKRYLGVRALLWWRRNETLSTSSPSRSPSATSIP